MADGSPDLLAMWTAVLAELRGQMTSSTFNMLLSGSRLRSADDNVLTVAVRSVMAKDWLEARLIDTVLRTVRGFYGDDWSIEFVVDDSLPAIETAVAGVEFPGFESLQSNFTQVPKQFFEVVVRAGPPVVVAFVAAVIDQTVGHIKNFHTGERREWWEASYSEISRVAGIGSRASVSKAIRLARERGYVIRKNGRLSLRYRLRRLGEPVDN